MKDKLLDALKSKFPGVSETTLNIVATNKAGKVKDEAQIASVVEGITFDHLIEAATDNKVADSNKQAIINAAKKSNMEYKDGVLTPIQQQQQQQTQQNENEVPAWAKQLIDQNKQLAEKVQGFETKTKQQNLTEKLAAKLTEKKIPLSLMKGHVLNEETEIETAFTEIETTFNEIRQEDVNNKTPEVVPGGGFSATTKQQVSAAIDAWSAGKATETNSETKK